MIHKINPDTNEWNYKDNLAAEASIEQVSFYSKVAALLVFGVVAVARTTTIGACLLFH